MERVEEKAMVLDYKVEGHSDSRSFKKEPFAHVIGKDYFTLLEVVPKRLTKEDKDAATKEGKVPPETDEQGFIKLRIHDEVYIGKEQRDKIHFIKGRIGYDKLTSVAQSEVRGVVEELVDAQEKRFVDFFNTAQAITIRMHQLELLPKLGKKLMMEILQERKKGPFTSFADIEARVKNIPRPREIIVERIMEEIRAESKYYIFTANPPKPKEEEERDGFRRHRHFR